MAYGTRICVNGSELWNDPKYLEEEGKQKRLIWKLKDLKDNTKQWQKLRYQQANAHLRGLEKDINSLLQNTLEGDITLEDETLIKISGTGKEQVD
jgi:hypothetical protein